MNETTHQTVRTLASALFALLMIIPSAAFAGLSTTAIQAEFSSGMTQSYRLSFTDEKKSDYTNDNFTGVVVTNEDRIWMVIEDEEEDISAEVTALQSDGRLASVTVVDELNPTSRKYNGLDVHAETDPRGEADATTGGSGYKKERIRLEFEDEMPESAKVDVVDGYFSNFADDGLGGVLVGDHDWEFLEVEIEGPEEYVDYWIMKLQGDESFVGDRVLHTATSENATLPELVSHITADTR